MLGYFSVLLCILLTLTGCSPRHLNVQTQYLSHENLASFRINTPDPELERPIIGQRLVITWFTPKRRGDHQNLRLTLKVRFKNHEEEEISIPIEKRCGTYLYSIVQEKYLTTKGISTYQVNLIDNNGLISSWKHPLWTELITFDLEDKESQPRNFNEIQQIL